jgi:hypothetical protein
MSCCGYKTGATVTFAIDNNNTDSRVNNNNWSGTNWIYDWYKSVGVIFDEVHAWEPPAGGRGKASGGVTMASQYRGTERGNPYGNAYERKVKRAQGKAGGRGRGKGKGKLHSRHRTLQEQEESFYPDGVLHFYNVGVTDVRGAQHNPLNLIKQICKPEDFVVFKLDIDSKFEINIVNQLLNDAELLALVDDFYYEHHVRNDVMRMHSLGKNSNQRYTLKAWYDMVTRARRQGLRMHFWP